MSSQNWNKFLTFLRSAKIHLFLRTINVHLQIIVNDHIDQESDEVTNEGVLTDRIKKEPLEVQTTYKSENIDEEYIKSDDLNHS